jgi:hypothetical protein
VVVGWGSTAGEIAQGIVAVPLGVRVAALYVVEADGTKVNENVAKLLPGVHDLTISCALYVGGNFMPQKPASVRAELAAGRVYALRPRPQAVSCAPYLEDVTESKTKLAP